MAISARASEAWQKKNPSSRDNLNPCTSAVGEFRTQMFRGDATERERQLP